MGLFSSAGQPRARRALGDVGQPLIPSRVGNRVPARPVTVDSSLGLSAVWACVGLRADVLSTMPLQQFRTGQGGLPPAQLPLSGVWTDPSADFDLGEWLFASQVSLELRGNVYGLVLEANSMGFPTQIELQHPDTVTPLIDASGQLRYRIKNVTYAKDEVWHERAYVLPGSPIGLSPIQYHAMSLGVQLAAEQYGSDWFTDGAHPSALLQNTAATVGEVDDNAAKVIKDRFLAAIRGNSGEPVVIGGDWKYLPLQVNPAEAQFIETMKYGDTKIARIFRTDPTLIGADAGNSMTYSNVEQRGINNLTYSFGPMIGRRERALSRALPRPQYVQFDPDGLLRTDLMTRYNAYAVALKAKWLAQDEVRQREDLQPLTDEQTAQIKDLGVTETARLTVPATESEIL